MIKAYKTEIDPTPEQIIKINKTIGTCRFIYNFYIAHNKEEYQKNKTFISGMSFSKWLNNEYIPNNPDYKWIKDVSSKAVKKSIMNGETAFKRFFKKQSKFPKFKKKNKSNVGIYFPKNNKTDFEVQRHRIKIPTLKWVKLKEKGYIPVDKVIKSGTITKKANRYYISVLVEEEKHTYSYNQSQGFGVDLGVRNLAIVSDGRVFQNINKTRTIKKIEKKLKREQRKLSRKYECLKQKQKIIKKEDATRQNIQKQIAAVQKLHMRLFNIREDYLNKVINELVKTKPTYINIEDLNVSGMMKNRHLSKAIAQQRFYSFRQKLINKCDAFGIEVRLSNRFYASSKTCSSCGCIKKDLKLSDKIFKCPDCGAVIDRDLNAAINLKNNQIYKIA